MRVWEAFFLPCSHVVRVSVTVTAVSASLVALPTDPKLPLDMVITSMLKDSYNFLPT